MKNYKNDFPLLQKHQNVAYLDNAATSQKPSQVLEAISHFYSTANAPIKRGLYQLAEEATEAFEQARVIIAAYINAEVDETIFTSGATESINFIAATWGQQHIKAGDEIVLTELEHHANLLPWQQCAHSVGARLKFIPVNDHGMLELENIDSIITEKTKLVSFLDVSNSLGTHVPVQQLVKRARQVGARLLIDACQSIPHQKVDVRSYDCDFLALSGHKMLGPTGIGVLYIKKDVQHEVAPYRFGGGMVFEATYASARFLKPPQCYEAGTPPVAQAIGLAAAVEYLNKVDFDWLKKHEAALCKKTIEGLVQLGLRVLGPIEQLEREGHLVSFVHNKYHFHDVAAHLDSKGICVRTGHYCAQPLARKLGIDGSIRVSFYLYNESKDVERLLEVLAMLV